MKHNNRRANKSHVSAQTLFFPAAALHAAIILPLFIYSLNSGRVILPGLINPLDHAHEMLFGFALAVVTGFLVNRITRPRLYLLFGLWLAARSSFLLLPHSILVPILNLVFAAWFLATTAPQFLKAAKKWRNQIFAPTIAALSLALAVFHLGSWWDAYMFSFIAAREAVLLLALLMAFMGGRVIAPAVAGYLQTLGVSLEARVQPRLEAAMILLMIAALISSLLNYLLPFTQVVTALCLMAAAAVSLIRLLRWRLWLCHKRTDLICLGVGYLWLVAGLAVVGMSYLLPFPTSAAMHTITVGALGTLTLTIMARTRVIKARRHPGDIRGLWLPVTLISIAAILRVGMDTSSGTLMVSALAWSAAFLLLLGFLLWQPALQRS